MSKSQNNLMNIQNYYLDRFLQNLNMHLFDELSLEDRCIAYWNHYYVFLSDSIDGNLLLKQVTLSVFGSGCLNKDFSIKGFKKSERFMPYRFVIERVM